MLGISRRMWMAALGLAPAGGALLAWAERHGHSGSRRRLTPRQRIQQKNLPNVTLTTHEGRQVRFYDDLIRDKRVVINFMYAECEGICVPVTSNLLKVHRMMDGRVGRDIFFYSITLKPERDTPDNLRHYAEMHGANVPGWLFLTGSPRDIETLRRSLGYVYIDPVEDADRSNHIGMLRYGVEAEMRWGACPGMARPDHILRSVLWDLEHPGIGRAS